MKVYLGTGRRKTSVARVRLSPGSGKVTVNHRAFEEYFPVEFHRVAAARPLKVTDNEGKYDIFINVDGGGPTGQAGAISLGIARALVEVDDQIKSKLRNHNLLTRDPRMVERKKYGRKKARKRFQFSKR